MNGTVKWIYTLALVALAGTMTVSASLPLDKKGTEKRVEVSAKVSRTPEAPARVSTPQIVKAEQTPAPGMRAALTSAPSALLAKGNNGGVRRGDTGLPTMYGLVIWASNWAGYSHPGEGLNIVPTEDGGSFQKVNNDDITMCNYTGTIKDNVYIGMGFEQSRWYSTEVVVAVNLDTKREIKDQYPEEDVMMPIALTYSYSDATFYCICKDPDSGQYVLNTVDFDSKYNRTWNRVGDLPGEYCALACTKQGQLYAISKTSESTGDDPLCTGSRLVMIDKATAAVTEVGETGMFPRYLTGAAIEGNSGRMYWAVTDNNKDSYLTEVNLTTGAATKICDFGLDQEVAGLAMLPPAAETKAPAAVTDVQINFEGASLEGTVSFNAPTLTFDGDPAEGDLTYTVAIDGTPAATGNTAFGGSVTANVAVAAAGTHTFDITVANEAGASPAVSVNKFVGEDSPAEFHNVSASYADGTMTVSWNALAGANGGYLDPAQVSYTVRQLLPGEETLAEGYSQTSWTRDIPEPESCVKYKYSVTAFYNGTEVGSAESDIVTIGSIVPPHAWDFEGDNPLGDFTIINANGDDRTWDTYRGHAWLRFSSSNPMDDWLITPAVRLEKNKVYVVTFKAAAEMEYYKERVEAFWGNANTVEGMTEELLPPTEIGWLEPDIDNHVFTKEIMPTETGKYYFGFHGISPASTCFLYIDDITISAGATATAPAAPELTVAADSEGDTTMGITVKAPVLTVNGSELTSITGIKVLRDGEEIHTFTDVAPGGEYTCQDNPAMGYHTYSAYAENEEGTGRETSLKAFSGVDLPASPTTVSMEETEHEGEVTVAWEPVTTDVNGNPVREGLVKYALYSFNDNGDPVLVADDIAALSHTFRAVEAGSQDMVQYAVFAKTRAGLSQHGALTRLLPVGTPYEDWHESFANGTLSSLFSVNTSRGGSVSIATDATFSDLGSQDGDNGYLVFNATAADQGADLATGKIKVPAENPYLLFWVFGMDGGSPDTNTIEVLATEQGADPVSLGVYTLSEIATPGQWSKVRVDLQQYAGKTVRLTFSATSKMYACICMDNIRVRRLYNHDLSGVSISAPASVKAGDLYKVSVVYSNEGLSDAVEHTVELYVNDELKNYKRIGSLAAGAYGNVDFSLEMPVLAEEPLNVRAAVNYGNEQFAQDNSLETLTVTPVLSKLPVPQHMTMTPAGNTVKLKWEVPEMSAEIADVVMEDFESAEPFAKEYADWTFVDRDGKPQGGIQNIDIPGITAGQTTGSFFVMECSEAYPQFNHTFASHSGNRHLASIFNADASAVDDWAISPRLSGDAQTISLWARSYSEGYPEKMEVLCADDSTDPADFEPLLTVDQVPGSWTCYNVELPQGARRFAIRSCATDAFMLFVDDVTYEKALDPASLELVGYDVYRNGAKINGAPVAETNFVDGIPYNAESIYRTTAVYTIGTSRGSAPAVYASSVDGMESQLRVSGAQGRILIEGAAGLDVKIVAADGRICFSGAGADTMGVPAMPGVYIVKAGAGNVKVIVR